MRVRLVAATPFGLVVLLCGPAPAAAPDAVIRTYRTACLKCHDTDGRGEIVRDVMPKVPDFTDAAWHATRSDADLSRSILEGRGKSMPPMRAKLGSVDVGQMVAFVRGFPGGKQVVEENNEEPQAPRPANASPPQPATGGPSTTRSGPPAVEPSRPGPREAIPRIGSRTFQRSCVACHGSDGRGGEMRDTLPSIPDFTIRTWQEAHSDPQLLVSILDGKGTGMPAFRDKLSREQIRELVALVRSFGPARAQAARKSSDDFESRFEKLVAEFEELRRRSQALSSVASPVEKAPGSSPSPPRR